MKDRAIRSLLIEHAARMLADRQPPPEALAHDARLLTALFRSAGDDPEQCRRSVERGRQLPAAHDVSSSVDTSIDVNVR